MRTSSEQRLRNRALRSRLRVAVKDLRSETDKDEAQRKYRVVSSLLDKAAAAHLIHHRNADRNKARQAQFVSKLG